MVLKVLLFNEFGYRMIKLLKYTIIALVVLFMVVSCKKKDVNSPSDSTNTSNNSSHNTIDPNNIYGTISLYKHWWVTPYPANFGGTFHVAPSYDADALFTATPFQDEMNINTPPPPGILAGDILINGDPLEKYNIPSDVYYSNDQSSGTISPPFSWVITGSGEIPPFNFSPQSQFPEFSNVNIFPDTVYLNKNLSINLGTMNDYTDAYLFVGAYAAGKINIIHNNYYSNIINVDSTNLQNNPPGPYDNQIQLFLIKKQYQSVAGKTYKFQNVLFFSKDSVVFMH